MKIFAVLFVLLALMLPNTALAGCGVNGCSVSRPVLVTSVRAVRVNRQVTRQVRKDSRKARRVARRSRVLVVGCRRCR